MDTAALASALAMLPLEDIVEVDSVYLEGLGAFYTGKVHDGGNVDPDTNLGNCDETRPMQAPGQDSSSARAGIPDPISKPGSDVKMESNCSPNEYFSKSGESVIKDMPTRKDARSISSGSCSGSIEEEVRNCESQAEMNGSAAQELSDEEDLDALLNMSRVSYQSIVDSN